MKRMKIVLFLLLLALGCAAGDRELLQKDHTAMNDEQLLDHYFQIVEQIEECESEPDRGGVGVGTRIGSGGFGFGMGISTGIGLHGCDLKALREQRIEVRKELRERGLIQ
ncbi:MAG: hypothetical protein ACOC0U_05535 [Desulfovibrionales bacterium]